MKSQYILTDNTAYMQWREIKCAAYPFKLEDLFCKLSSNEISSVEYASMLNVVDTYNLAFYRLHDASNGSKQFMRQLGKRFGLQRLDGNLCADEDNITSLQVMDTGRANTYIPYTDKPLSWHTDGYYNDESRQIRAIYMHCKRAAKEGGENLLMDHEMAYIQLRDENPEFIQALMHPNAMTIPPNIENGKEIRAAQTGAVLSFLESGELHMRYSARSRNIEWRDDKITQQAVAFLSSILSPNNPYVIAYGLEPGEGIICNNVLHNRSRFVDEPDQPGRLLYRARYYDRVMAL